MHRGLKRRTRKAFAITASAVTVAAVAFTGAVAVPAIAAPGDGTLTVEVNRDFSGDGVYEAALDPGQAGVNVTVSDGTNSQTLVTDGAGQAAFDLSAFAGSSFRVDVSIDDPDLAYLQPAPAAQDTTTDAFRSTTTFVGGATQTIHVGVWNPNTYVPRDPEVIVVQQKDYQSSSGLRSILATTWNTRGTSQADPTSSADNTTDFTTLATQAETGTVFGTAWDYRRENLFSAAYVKAHTAYGPGGIGGLYRTDTAAGGTSGNTILWATVPDAGTAVHEGIRGHDAAMFLANGREGLGGLAVSEDGSTLYVVNLNNRSLYSYDAAAAAPASPIASVPIADPGCVGGDWRPFSVTARDGAVYVGGVCDASTSLAREDLAVKILRLDGAAFTEIYTHGLDFLRGNEGSTTDPVGNLTGPLVSRHWNPWRETFDDDLRNWMAVDERRQAIYPMPMLTSFAFENDGSIVLAFRDRKVDAFVGNGFAPDGVTEIGGHLNTGDINKVCLTDSVYEWEGEGACANNATTANSGQPADRVEYFPGEFMLGAYRYPGSTVRHLEAGLGAVLLSPREPDIIGTSLNAAQIFNTNGLGWYDRVTGEGPGNDWEARALHVAGNIGQQNFAKGAGLGNISLLAAPAPIQIGNRVWFDSDHDGIQDPGEISIPGATINLLDADGNILATTTTDANGEYYFGGEGGYELVPGVDYIIEFDLTTVDVDALPGSPSQSELEFTLIGSGSNPEHDSNAVPTDANPLIGRSPVRAPEVGGVDHSIDAGIWFELPVPAIDIVKFDGRATPPANPVDGPDAVDGVLGDPTPGDWAAGVDADTLANAVEYPLTDASSGAQPVSMIVTNTGELALTDVSVADLTVQGPGITGLTCDFSRLGGPETGVTWEGPFQPGDWFPCTSNLTMGPDQIHHDIASVTGQPVDDEGDPFGGTIGDEDPYWAVTPPEPLVPGIDIVKFDGRATPPENPVDGPDAVDGELGDPTPGDWAAGVDADTQDDAVQYPLTDGTTGAQPVSMIVTNTGELSLIDVSVADLTVQGPAITGLTCDFSPLGGPETGVTWAGPFHPNESFTCTSTLTMGPEELHQDVASVSGQPVQGEGDVPVGDPIGDEDHYWAETPEVPATPGIDIVKFDGRATAPENPVDGPDAVDGEYGGPTQGAWTADVDADTEANAVQYPLTDGSSGAQPVSMIVTNTGEMALTDVTVADLTVQGPAIADLTCDFSPLGGPETGVTWEGPFQPNDSFICTSTLTMGPDELHQDVASVTGQPVDDEGTPVGESIGDEDHYWAETPAEELVPGIDIVKFDGRETPPANPVDGPDAVDGELGDPTPGDWATGDDADTQGDAVQYPLTDGSSGAQPVSMIVTNTGELALADVSVADLTVQGPAIADLTCDFSPLGGPATGVMWDGPFQPGDSFTCTSTLTMGPDELHQDVASVTGQPVDDEGTPVGESIGDEDHYWAETPAEELVPGIDIVKFDGRETAPANPVDGPDAVDGELGEPTPGDWAAGVDADTQGDAVEYPLTDGSSGAQPVSMIVTNTGEMALADVSVADLTVQGPAIADLTCNFAPLGGPATGVMWDGPFQPGDSFTCTSTLTMGPDELHQDVASVTGQPVDDEGTPVGESVGDEDHYWAETPEAPVEPGVPAIDIVKFDGRETAPANPVDGPDAVDGELGEPTPGDWAAGVDADTLDDAVEYAVTDGTTGAQPVSMIVTNTGELALTGVSVADATVAGPDVTGLTCDFSPLGGPTSGVTWDGPFQPGDSFTCTSTLTMGADELHQDVASVTGQPVDDEGTPVGESIGDEDHYWAVTPETPVEPGVPALEITKRDAATGDEADTAKTAIDAVADRGVRVEMPVKNTGDVALTEVVVSDRTDDGPAMTDFVCTFPDDTKVRAVDGSVRWAASFGDDPMQWEPGVTFTCSGVVTLGADDTHANTVSVVAVTPDGETLTDDDPFHVRTPRGPALPATGGTLDLGLIGLALGMTGLGGALLLIRRRADRARV